MTIVLGDEVFTASLERTIHDGHQRKRILNNEKDRIVVIDIAAVYRNLCRSRAHEGFQENAVR